MKRIALLVLTAAAAVDVSQQAYNSDLPGAIAVRGDQSVLDVVVQSPVMTTIEHWALFILGFAFLSLVMATRKNRNGPDIIA